ncbi:MAG TPA: O-antigen ligase family protein [Anaerolineales bacterium]|jgi:O-antigen ligase
MPTLAKLSRFLWAAALLTLPVTSFRWFPLLGDDTLVRPLALYPLALLLPILLLQAVGGVRPFPWTGSTILAALFALVVLVVTAAGVLYDPIPLRGQTYVGRALRALATLVIGLSFFVSAAWMNRDQADFKVSLRWLLAGLGLDLAWSGLQAVTFYTGLLQKEMVTHWQLTFSMRELVRTNRISGLAYEPAWLAGQIATIYMPVLFAAVLTGTRTTRFRWLEPVLLVLTALLVLATYSRGGILITAGVSALTLMLVGRHQLRAAWTWFTSGFRRGASAWIMRLGLIAAVVAVLFGAIAFLSQKNYFRRIWEISADNFTDYLVDINAGSRSAYSSAALAAFDAHPLSGVGLGASGFWIYDNLPDWALTTVPEIAKQLNPQSHLYPNPKNMYVRLLAETGLAGFVLFLVFQLSILGDALAALRRSGTLRFLGCAGLFASLAIALHNLTQDSFATPNIWLIPGLLAGMSAIASAAREEPR